MTGPEVTAAMRPEDVPAELVEKAARAAYARDPLYRTVGLGKITDEVIPWDELPLQDILGYREDHRHALAAVVPDIQAQALEEAADVFEWARDDADYAAFQGWLRDRAIEKRAARLTATTEEPK